MKQTFIRIIALIAVLLTVTAAHADWRFGLKASYDNTGATWMIDGEKYTTRNISGFSAGPAVAYEFIDYFSIESGIYFSMNGFATAEHSFIKGIEYTDEETVRLYYLQLPIYAIGQYPLKNDITLLLQAGPHFACGLADDVTRHINFNSLSYKEEHTESNIAFDKKISRFNVAMHLGIGAEYQGARILVGYDFGLFDTSLIEDTELRSGGFSVSIGYMF